MNDALLVIDVFTDFDHEDGAALLASFREHAAAMSAAIAAARSEHVPVVYVNDHHGRWDGDAPGLVRAALAEPGSGDVLLPLAPAPGDRFVLNARSPPSTTHCMPSCCKTPTPSAPCSPAL